MPIEEDKEKKKTKTTRILPQKGEVKDLFLDSQIVAFLPGRRETAWGTVYWETRKNRSDALGKKV